MSIGAELAEKTLSLGLRESSNRDMGGWIPIGKGPSHCWLRAANTKSKFLALIVPHFGGRAYHYHRHADLLTKLGCWVAAYDFPSWDALHAQTSLFQATREKLYSVIGQLSNLNETPSRQLWLAFSIGTITAITLAPYHKPQGLILDSGPPGSYSHLFGQLFARVKHDIQNDEDSSHRPAFISRARQLFSGPDLRELAADVQHLPILSIHNRKDRIIFSEESQTFLSKWPLVKRVLLPRGNHLCGFIANAEIYGEQVRQYIAQLDQGGRNGHIS